jgi:hypothetical protein
LSRAVDAGECGRFNGPMAQIRLKPQECVRGYLPLVCVRCGQLADDSKPYYFSRIPTWLYLAFFAAGVPCLIGAVRLHFTVLAAGLVWVLVVYLVRRSITVDLPVCPRHRRRLGVNTAALVLLVPLIVILIFAVVLLPLWLERQGVFVSGYALCMLPVLLFAMLGVAVALNRGGIRTSAITDAGITLKGVHPYFADVVRELRDAKYDE